MDIFQAASVGDSHRLRWMLGEGISPNTLDHDGHTPLMLAARAGYLDAVELLLAAGADLEAKGPYNVRPLMFAAGSGHFAVVQRLVEKGASISARAENGTIAELEAYSYGHRAVGDFLKQAATKGKSST